MKRVLLAAFVVLTGCGRDGINSVVRGGPAPGDAGLPAQQDAEAGVDAPSEAPAGVPLLSGKRSFVITSRVTPVDPNAAPGYPTSHTFTLVLDADARLAIAGATGSGQSLRFDSADGLTFHLMGTLTFTFPGACIQQLFYENPTFTLAPGDKVTGSAAGSARYMPGGAVATPRVTMAFDGVSDHAPPTLSLPAGTDPTDPFDSYFLLASEPLPFGASPKLVSASGDSFPLIAVRNGPSFILAFQSPHALLRFDEAYHVDLGGVTDFAGNGAGAGLDFHTRMPPTLLAEDGFESVTATNDLGDALLGYGPGFPVISGKQSLFVPPADEQTSPGATPRLTMRFALEPGDTVIRFKYRTVDVPLAANSGVDTTFAVASIGTPVRLLSLSGSNAPKSPFNLRDRAVLLGPVLEGELPLPTDATGEIFVQGLAGVIPTCGMKAPPLQGIIIDDVTVE